MTEVAIFIRFRRTISEKGKVAFLDDANLGKIRAYYKDLNRILIERLSEDVEVASMKIADIEAKFWFDRPPAVSNIVRSIRIIFHCNIDSENSAVANFEMKCL